MSRNTECTGIQFRTLNKGAWSIHSKRLFINRLCCSIGTVVSAAHGLDNSGRLKIMTVTIHDRRTR